MPGTVTVSVITSEGTVSGGVDLDLVETVTFDVNNLSWTTTTALPVALRGLRSVSIPNTDTSAFVIVAGGNDGTNNVDTVLSNTLAEDGQLGASWSTQANTLPVPRAHHGMAEASPRNAFLSTPNDRFVYVLGGQEDPLDAPGGVNTVFYASVSTIDGSVGVWSATTPLPQALLGPAVAVFNGFIYVVGGLRSDGTPSAAVYSAQILSDGALGSWTTSPNAYPLSVSFATSLGFGGNLYVIDGDTSPSADPNAQGAAGVKNVYFAGARSGVVGTWTATEQTVKQRKKHVTWAAFGQIISAEGVYEGLAGSLELERTFIQPDGTLGAWNGITANANQIGANVYNAASLVSPIRPSGGAPRFLLFGGQSFTLTPPGALSSTVYYNSAP